MPIPGDPRSVASPARRSDRPDPDASLPPPNVVGRRTALPARALRPHARSAQHQLLRVDAPVVAGRVRVARPAPEPGSPRRRLAGTARRAGDSSRSYPAFPEIKDWPASPVRPTGGPSPAPTPRAASPRTRRGTRARPAPPRRPRRSRHPPGTRWPRPRTRASARWAPSATPPPPRARPGATRRAAARARHPTRVLRGLHAPREHLRDARHLARPTMVPPEGTYPTWHTP